MNIQEKATRITEFFNAKQALTNNLQMIDYTINSAIAQMKEQWGAMQLHLDTIKESLLTDPNSPCSVVEYNELVDKYNEATAELTSTVTVLFGAVQIAIGSELGTFKNYEKL